MCALAGYFSGFSGTDDVVFNGEVWIGDPCCIIKSNNSWSELMDYLYGINKEESWQIKHGVKISTPYGQFIIMSVEKGDYCLKRGEEWKVFGSCRIESGFVSIIPTPLLNKIREDKERGELLLTCEGICVVVNDEICTSDGQMWVGEYYGRTLATKPVAVPD